MEGNSLKSDGKEIVVDDDDFSDVSLRLMDLDDVDDFMEWARDEKVNRFWSCPSFSCKEDAMRYMENSIISNPWFRAICLKNKPVGTISVTANSGSDKCRGEIGYVVASKYWGKGVATQAVRIVAAAIFWEWPHLERLEALVDVENVGSQRVLEKAGFLREGVLRKYYIFKGRARDMVMFSLLSTDPQA